MSSSKEKHWENKTREKVSGYVLVWASGQLCVAVTTTVTVTEVWREKDG